MPPPTRPRSLLSLASPLAMLCLAAVTTGGLAACVDPPAEPPGDPAADSFEGDIDDEPPTFEEQQREMELRSRLVAEIDPGRWAGFEAEGNARFATPDIDPPDPDIDPPDPDADPPGERGVGDGVLVLADGRQFRQHHESFERMAGLARPSEVDLERSVIGADDRTAVAKDDYTRYPWRAVGAILSKKDSKSGFCTATLIGPRLAITAGHCVYNKDTNAWMWNTWFSPGHRGRGDDRFPNGKPRRVIGLFSFDGWSEDENTQHDVGFLLLEDEASTASLGWFGFSNRWSASDHVGITATTLQYPGWKFSCADSPDASGQCFGFQYRGTGTVDATCGNKLAHSVDTNKGSSGSPFYRWSGGGRYIIGPHTNGLGSVCGLQRNSATILTDSKVGSACDLLLLFPSAFASAGCS